MPVGGMSSFYTNWQSPAVGNGQTYNYQWETFLTSELPAYLSANKGISPTGNAVVGLSMSGNSALILAAYHPNQFTLRRLAVGFSEPVPGGLAHAGRLRDARLRRLRRHRDVGSRRRAGMAAQRPDLQAGKLAANGTRLWVYTGNGTPDGAGRSGSARDVPGRADEGARTPRIPSTAS